LTTLLHTFIYKITEREIIRKENIIIIPFKKMVMISMQLKKNRFFFEN